MKIGMDLLGQGADDEAVETSLRRALAITQQQGAEGWELDAALNLARLSRNQGKRTDARDLLAPIYG
jgi:hypothetical protein